MRLFAVTLDCAEPSALARFYQDLLGGRVYSTNDTFVALSIDGGIRLDFQRVDAYDPPRWPDRDSPAQSHLDFVVDDLARAERSALAAGAWKPDFQPGGDQPSVCLLDFRDEQRRRYRIGRSDGCGD